MWMGFRGCILYMKYSSKAELILYFWKSKYFDIYLGHGFSNKRKWTCYLKKWSCLSNVSRNISFKIYSLAFSYFTPGRLYRYREWWSAICKQPPSPGYWHIYQMSLRSCTGEWTDKGIQLLEESGSLIALKFGGRLDSSATEAPA